jgi:hypothetical protein
MRTVEFTTITGEQVVTWVPETMSDEEIAQRLRAHHDFAVLGYSRSPRAMAMPPPTFLPELAPRESRRDWSAPKPRRRMSWAQEYWEKKRESWRRNGAMYDRHLRRG